MKSSYIVVCRSCGTEHEIKIKDQDMIDWKNGKHIQDAMPYVNVDDRELLISGICGKCFDNLMGDE